MTPDDFREVAKELGKAAWTDEELLRAIKVHQCLLAYFRERGEGMIVSAIRTELNAFESAAFARGWKCNECNWQIGQKYSFFAHD